MGESGAWSGNVATVGGSRAIDQEKGSAIREAAAMTRRLCVKLGD